MGTKLVQGGILVALVGIAGLLYSIKQQMSPQQPAAVTPVEATAPATQAAYNAPVPQASRPSYQTIPRPSPVQSSRAPAPDYSQPPAPVETYTPPPQPVVSLPPPAPPAPAVQSVTVPAGTAIAVRLLDRVSTEQNRAGDTFQATLEEPLMADGMVVADRGATVMGRVVQAQQSGRVAGLAELALELDRIRTVAGDVQIASDTMIRRADSSRTKDAVTAGTMAGIGAAIGAIAGGRRGAGIGGAAGGAAGAGTVMGTRGKPVEFEPETRLTFRLRAPITVTVDAGRIRTAPTGNDPDRPHLQRRYQ